ncbi:hypothetical protein ACFC09_43465 [Streptomyces sp. NPDC056161]|uniref:hypothetical protein n=1 Tax=Streptomyces sp. NPDC056161 TaxID=3345732 RepID=UPI0035DA21DE
MLAVYFVGFLEGACAHFLDLARGGIHVYASFGPFLLQVFFVSLAVLDPLVVVLVVLARPEGIRLASWVTVLDVSANWWANRHWLQDDPARLLSLLPITLFGLFAVASSGPVLRVMKRPHLSCTIR